MMRRHPAVFALALAFAPMLLACHAAAQGSAGTAAADTLRLPAPRPKGPLSVEEALATRRSLRQWAKGSLSLPELSQLAWAAQGITSPEGKRTAPSAMGRYPIELYVVANDVQGLAPGIYRYVPRGHGLVLVTAGDRRAEVAKGAAGQASVASAPAVLIVAAVPARLGARGERTDRFVAVEAGAVLQNIYLQATSLGLGAVAVGGFRDADLAAALPLRADEQPIIVVPVGRRP
jgi:SagB-type dehydrogenase family enzyme